MKVTVARLTDTLAYLPFALAAVVTGSLLIFPSESTITCESVPGDQAQCVHHPVTLVQSEGWGVLVWLVLPVIVAGLPLVFQGRRRRMALILASGLLLSFVILSAASVGLFYLPAAIAMLIITIGAARRRATTSADQSGQSRG